MAEKTAGGSTQKKSQGEVIDELMNYLRRDGALGVEIAKQLEDMPDRYAALLVTKQEKNSLLMAHLVENYCKGGAPGIFVTLNRSAEDLLKPLEENGIDCSNLAVIDAISKTKGENEKGNVFFVDSPQDLTELEAQIAELVEKMPPGKKFFILDSLSTMLIYNAEKNVEKFVHTLGEKLRSLGFRAVFTIMEGTRPEIMNVLSQFCDKVIKPGPTIIA